MSKITVAAIKEKYPKPVSALHETAIVEETYCVGGAFCMATGSSRAFRFPSSLSLFIALCRYTGKNRNDCMAAAANIVNFNDDSAFDSAWEELRKILEFKASVISGQEAPQEARGEGKGAEGGVQN